MAQPHSFTVSVTSTELDPSKSFTDFNFLWILSASKRAQNPKGLFQVTKCSILALSTQKNKSFVYCLGQESELQWSRFILGTPFESFQRRELFNCLCLYPTNTEHRLSVCHVPGSVEGEMSPLFCQRLHSQGAFDHRGTFGNIWRWKCVFHHTKCPNNIQRGQGCGQDSAHSRLIHLSVYIMEEGRPRSREWGRHVFLYRSNHQV